MKKVNQMISEQKRLHDILKSCGTGFPWTMQLEEGWDITAPVWAIRDGHNNIISWVRQESHEAYLWHFVLTLLNAENNGWNYYGRGSEDVYKIRPILDK